jgi:hypothetical protein
VAVSASSVHVVEIPVRVGGAAAASMEGDDGKMLLIMPLTSNRTILDVINHHLNDPPNSISYLETWCGFTRGEFADPWLFSRWYHVDRDARLDL